MNRLEVIKTIDSLIIDLKNNDDSWQNPTLEQYLDAIQAWLENTKNEDVKPSWELIIDMLIAGKIYE